MSKQIAGQMSLFDTLPVTMTTVVEVPKPKKAVDKPVKKAKAKLSPIQKFIKENEGRVIEDNLSVASDDFKSFCRSLKNALNKEAKSLGFDYVTLKPNHYDMSGFFKKGDLYAYWSFCVSRYDTPTTLKSKSCGSGFLYRTAKSETDFTGGNNNFTDLEHLCGEVLTLLEREERRKAV